MALSCRHIIIIFGAASTLFGAWHVGLLDPSLLAYAVRLLLCFGPIKKVLRIFGKLNGDELADTSCVVVD